VSAEAVIDEGAIGRVVRSGSVVALGDGIGSPVAMLPALSRCVEDRTRVRLVLGWMPADVKIDPRPFARVTTFMAGYALRPLVEDGSIRYLPVRLGNVPALLAGPLRPDILLASVVRCRDGALRFATEVSWMRAAVDAGATVLAVERPDLPSSDAGPPLPDDRMTVVGCIPGAPSRVAFAPVGPAHRAIADRVLPLIPAGARLQFAPGAVAAALLELLQHPVAIDTGMLTDEVVDLDARGALVGRPIAPYLAGERAVEWAAWRSLLHPVEVTHHPGRLAEGAPLVAVNTALEIDTQGQVNVESVGGAAIAGIGGQPDYAAAAARSAGGLSIVALPTEVRGEATLREQLSAPASTPAHDVDVVVTERGSVDLRGLDRTERRHALTRLWGA
jgi:acyl-CoA hydrolase